MYAIALFAVLACVTAAPHFHHNHHHGYGPPSPFGPRDEFDLGDLGMGNPFGDDHYFRDNIFDTRRFWAELSREMAMLDQMLNSFSKRFPSSVSSEGIDTKTNEYKITISLKGFEEQDIKVKAREGLLMVQAIKKEDGAEHRNYLDVRTLPDYVNVTGTWTFDEGVLKIVFPLLKRPEGGEETTNEITTEITTEIPEQFKPESREETTGQDSDDNDADVGVARGDVAGVKQLLTNEMPDRFAVEATTYAVDLKDDVEFVPVKY